MADRIRLSHLEIRAGEDPLVKSATLDLEAGEVVAMVGSSGSGKTLTARSLLGLPGPTPGVVQADLEIRSGERVFRPYYQLPPPGSRARRRKLEARFRSLRGAVVGYLPQDARGALDPLWSVRRIVQEAVDLAGCSDPVETWLQRAGFPDPGAVVGLYPHQLSGGMAQRVCIALGLARGSRFLVADEPTTGLDPTVQEAILKELAATAERGVGVLLITHDLRLIPRLARRVVIMEEGRVVERVDEGSLSGVQTPEGRALVEATSRIAGGWL